MITAQQASVTVLGTVADVYGNFLAETADSSTETVDTVNQLEKFQMNMMARPQRQ